MYLLSMVPTISAAVIRLDQLDSRLKDTQHKIVAG